MMSARVVGGVRDVGQGQSVGMDSQGVGFVDVVVGHVVLLMQMRTNRRVQSLVVSSLVFVRAPVVVCQSIPLFVCGLVEGNCKTDLRVDLLELLLN